MQVLSRISFPTSPDVSSLYMQCDEGAVINFSEGDYPSGTLKDSLRVALRDRKIVFSREGSLSLTSYFNSFYESFYAKYTKLNSLYYLLRLEGDFMVSLYQEIDKKSARKLISVKYLEDCQLSKDTKVFLPNLQENKQQQGRIYLELVCLSDRGVFEQGLIATDEVSDTEVSLAIISCTYKKEVYIKKTVDTILQDPLLQTKQVKIFLVDNGQTLNKEDFLDSRVELIPNRNLGGSGGFTRGLVAALEANDYSHFVFMDDDIELNSESVYRLFGLYEYAKDDFAIAGAMLDLNKKTVLYEAGALYSIASHTMKYQPFSLTPLKHELELENPNRLNLLLAEDNIDYGGFWFFSFSRKTVEQIGLPLPFFIKVDDIEFGLRIKQALQGKIVAFPAIAVWHEPFYLKFIVWDHYYYIRNHLITYAIHQPLLFIRTFVDFTKQLIYELFLFEYNFIEMQIKAFEDYIKGPDWLKHNDPEKLHASVLALSKSHKTQNVQQNEQKSDRVFQKGKSNILRKLLALLTLNGHLLPDFLMQDDEALILLAKGYGGQRSQALGKKRVLIYREEMSKNNQGIPSLFQNEIDKSTGIKLLFRWLKVITISGIKWRSLRKQWKDASNELTSSSFWQQYLDINIEKKV
jgi:galactofuranosylgalactofuranosylrhamnosyl-N-acetylglucosaminyl-diphospho-decaprenol beta-1,5/1,6-galactofuranosyltransferase